MSYDISLVDPVTKITLEADSPHQMKGGTYALGGTTSMELNITYNYSTYYYTIFGPKGIRTLYGKSGAETIPLLEDAIKKLGDEIDEDYWKATEGNAKRPLFQLLAMAKMRPEGIWEGD